MSTKEAVTIVCRMIAIYFLVWLLVDLTYLPSELYSLGHYQGGATTLSETAYFSYMRGSHLISLTFLLLRMVVLFFAVQWFYRAGPRLQAYFLAPLESDDEIRTE